MKFSEPQKLSDGRYFVKTKNDDDSRVFLQLNKVKLLTPYAEGDDVTLHTEQSFHEFDSEIMNAAKENSTSWFGREVQAKTIEAAYQKSTTNDTMIVNKFSNMKAFDTQREQIDANDILADTVCDCVIEFIGLWFMKKTFGAHWRLVQVRKKKEPKLNVYNTYLFTDDHEDQENSDDDDDSSL
tara:strand:- start:667 stop:1215 length:549 start_codon:yes stop_codon:yes gene_type:complete